MNKETQSVYLRTYLSLMAIYRDAADESLEETQALDLMNIVWNLLTKEEADFLGTVNSSSPSSRS